MDLTERSDNIVENYKEMKDHFNPHERNKKESRKTMKEFLTSQDAPTLVPRVIVGVMREAIEPNYTIGTSLMQSITVYESNVTVEFPSVGVLRAHKVAEGQPYPEEVLDFQRHRMPQDLRIEKIGLKIAFTEDTIKDSQWDVVGLHLRAAGRAMARYKEEWCFREIMRHAHPIFDNTSANLDQHTTGLGVDGMPNNTFSVMDFIDLASAVMANGLVPNTFITHALVWPVWTKSELLGAFGHQMMLPGQQQLYPSRSNITLGPEAISKQMPMPWSVLYTPFVELDRLNKTYNTICLDSNNVGAIIQKEPMNTEEFDEPSRDIKNIKIREKYTVGIMYEGRAVTTAKNIALAPSHNRPLLIRQV